MILKQWETKPPPGVGLDAGKSGNIIAHFAFNEADGSKVYNLPADGNDGEVAAGSPAWIGGALSFDGTTDRINTADTAFMDGIGQFSISTRVRKNVQPLGALGNIVAKDGAGNAGFYLQIQPGNRVVFFVNTTVSSATFSNADTEISDTEWHDIVAIYTGANLNVWLDGVLSSEQNALTGALFSSAHPLSFGAEDRAQILFDGRIDYVTIWDRVLLPNEIAQLCANPWHLHEPIRIPISVVAAPADDLLLLQNTNLRGNLQDLRGGMR